MNITKYSYELLKNSLERIEYQALTGLQYNNALLSCDNIRNIVSEAFQILEEIQESEKET